MNTTILTVNETNLQLLEPVAGQLRNGALAAFPTETVYGLGAVYNNDKALREIFAVKGRPADNPLIVHIWKTGQLAELTGEVSSKAGCLINRFWPGPLTIIFPKRPEVSPVVTAGLDTVAVRMPSHPVARELLRLTGIPVAAPSANLSGRPSPTRGSHVIEDLNGKIDFIIDAGPCSSGVESTVVSLASAQPLILRPGSVTREMLEAVLKEPVGLVLPGEIDRPQAPGMKYRHYAPKAPATLVEGENHRIVETINSLLSKKSTGQRMVVLSSTENIKEYKTEWVLDLGSRNDPATIANRLYDLLRFCDHLAADHIYIEGIPDQGVGTAVLNRFRKAAGGNVIHVS
ncbi:MAG: L-threonylcarbamoyladenylate synthase [Bacillota bacterium]